MKKNAVEDALSKGGEQHFRGIKPEPPHHFSEEKKGSERNSGAQGSLEKKGVVDNLKREPQGKEKKDPRGTGTG